MRRRTETPAKAGAAAEFEEKAATAEAGVVRSSS